MHKFVILCLCSAGLGLSGQGVEVSYGRQTDGMISLVSNTGDAIPASLRITEVKISDRVKGVSRDRLIVTARPVGGTLTWWMLVSGDSPDAVKRWVSRDVTFAIENDNRIVAFTPLGRSLALKASADHFVTEAAAREAIDTHLKTQRVRAFDWGRELELEDVFGQAFVVLNESIGGPFVGLRLISVLPSDAGWELRIRNPKGEMRVLNLANDLTVRK